MSSRTATLEPSDGTITRYAESIGGDLGLTLAADGSGDLTLANLHGDVVTTVPIAATAASGDVALGVDGWSDFTEYGAPRAGSTTATTGGSVGYGWLGAKQRSSTSETAGLTLMGDRLYNAATGRFTSLDPEPGGNDTSYSYPNDPINMFDLDGHWPNFRKVKWGKWIDRAGTGLAIAGMFGCAVCAAVSAGISLGRGIYKVRHHDRSGWLDIAGAGAFGAAKGLRYAGRIWKSRNIAKYAKGVRGKGSYHRRMRQRISRQHRRYERTYVHRADRIDRWYGAATTAHSAYNEYRAWRNR